MANHMLVVSRCFVPRTTKAAHISTPHLKTFWVRFLGKYRMNELRLSPSSFDLCFPVGGAIITAVYAVLRVN